ncbi:Sec-independent protein translocase subunit TatB [Raineyella antarctica]|uniref:Sec-independent protein translocase subunit TatB n=1 Tax=Raineyella antarctica TaxID=1577474 RepID=UPI00158808B6|nr:Sec-independent protein translocase subunit TatB [Raineyella antarctica]
MFGLGAGEIAFIAVIAVILWGPDKLPELARKAARLIQFFRQVANNAQTSVRSELGPGFEDFDITDPKGSVRRYVMKQGGLDGVDDLVATLREATAELDDAAADIRRTIDANGDGVIDAGELAAARAAASAGSRVREGAPFDPEAT